MRSQVLILSFLSLIFSNLTFAVPMREELYRNDRLGVVVYKDSQQSDVFWYLPQMKLYENRGQVVHYERAEANNVAHYLYVVPTMTDDMLTYLAGEIPGARSRSQFKPLIVTRFGVQVPQFGLGFLGETVTDFRYINSPQLLKMTLPQGQSEELNFFLQNNPGVQANIIMYFESERMDKYLTIELSHKEVANALSVGVGGSYRFTRAQIENAVGDYVSRKYMTMRSKGDLPIPDIVNKTIEECFTPVRRAGTSGGSTPPRTQQQLAIVNSQAYRQNENLSRLIDREEQNLNSDFSSQSIYGGDIRIGIPDGPVPPPTRAPGTPSTGGTTPPTGTPTTPGGGPTTPTAPTPNSSDPSLMFTFKRELINSDRKFIFRQEHFTDAVEVVVSPLYLRSTVDTSQNNVRVTAIPRQTMVVRHDNTRTSPLNTGIRMDRNTQLVIDSEFTYFARSSYRDRLGEKLWLNNWPSPKGDLYYRIGDGPWVAVNGRVVIDSETISEGELQLALDRESIWQKIPVEYRRSSMLIIPPVLTFDQTFPQFNLVVSGRRVEF